MTIKELEQHLKVVRAEYKGRLFGDYLELTEIEDEETYDQYAFYINYDFQKERFVCGVSCYRASEDNHCENQEGHTEEIDYYENTLEELINTLKNEYGKIFETPFNKKLEKGAF